MMEFLTGWPFFFSMLGALVVLIGVFLYVRNKKEED
jgi:LPXTG-motif cell wall-anchored protein